MIGPFEKGAVDSALASLRLDYAILLVVSWIAKPILPVPHLILAALLSL
jgi:hypothetical protein